jgi:hypothetical protein
MYKARKFVKENISEEFLAKIWCIGIIHMFDKLKKEKKWISLFYQLLL